VRAGNHFRSRSKLRRRWRTRPHPGFRFILRQNDVGKKAWNLQILGDFIAKIDLRVLGRQHLGNENRSRSGVVPAISSRAVNHHIRISECVRSRVKPERRNDHPLRPTEQVPQQHSQIGLDKRVRSRRARQRHDTASGKLIILLFCLYPREERSLVHAQIWLEIHDRAPSCP
jgi:hypothetical protein